MLKRNELEVAARVMQALAHPLRLAILQRLQHGECTVSQLYEELDSSQSMMSQQLRILESQGLIVCRKAGICKYCSIRNPDILQLFHCMSGHLQRFLKVEPQQENHS